VAGAPHSGRPFRCPCWLPVRGFLGHELAEPAVAVRVVQERAVVLVKDAEEFVPGNSAKPVVVVAARLVIINAEQPTALAAAVLGGRE
jgi:hypothetical protein